MEKCQAELREANNEHIDLNELLTRTQAELSVMSAYKNRTISYEADLDNIKKQVIYMTICCSHHHKYLVHYYDGYNDRCFAVC